VWSGFLYYQQIEPQHIQMASIVVIKIKGAGLAINPPLFRVTYRAPVIIPTHRCFCPLPGLQTYGHGNGEFHQPFPLLHFCFVG